MADSGEASTRRRLQACYALALALLLLVTWKLWAGTTGFPQVPAFVGLLAAPRDLGLPLLLLSQAAAVGVALLRRSWSAFWGIQTAFVLLSFGLNQHRLQVWAYHLAIAGLITACSRPGQALRRLRWLTISIYAWSAVSKLDAGFAAGPGRTLLGGLFSAVGLEIPAGTLGQALPWVMPAGELAAAAALAWPRFCRVGLGLSLAMHALLLLAVGPLGLQHEPGVQIWNLLFIAQNVLLFAGPKQAASPEPAETAGPAPGLFREAGILVVLALPGLQPWGYWDVWPSWAVYSTRGGWTTSFIHRDDLQKLPPDVAPFLGEPPPLSDWHPIDIDAWSLKVLHCPVYPQPRFRLAVAAALSRHAPIRVERRSPPNRRTAATTLTTLELVDGKLPPEVAQEFWLNTTPRQERP